MKNLVLIGSVVLATSLGLMAQDPFLLDPQGIRQSITTEKDKGLVPDATPRPAETTKPTATAQTDSDTEILVKREERQKQAQELNALKAREGGPRRFAQDLFETREEMPNTTEGGIAEDYVLGLGDQLQILGFGSATFEVPASVNGRGEVLIPKVGTVKVSGMTLGNARTAIQRKVNQQLAGTSVDVSVTKLRQVRIFILGEVYKPGSYLVPSLSSLVSVLGLAGGPNTLGSFRQIRVIRGGNVIHQIDLYPLRAEGTGNLNFSLQTGDTLFVPLAFIPVLLEGSFVRVAGTSAEAGALGGRTTALRRMDAALLPKNGAKDAPTELAKAPTAVIAGGLPSDDKTPLQAMLFEFLPGETAKDALRFAGGLLPKAYVDGLTLRREDPTGATNFEDIPMERAGSVPLRRGDVLSALPRRDRMERMVTVAGWVRVPGQFARTDGLTVGALLKHESQLMPDTYLQRGNIIRTLPDGSTHYLSFDVTKALTGDSSNDLLLADRDRVELYPIDRMRLPKSVTLSGPFTQAGVYEFHDGMRVADLVFKAGVPQKSANRMAAELARSRYGQPSEIRKLELAKLLSTEADSPVNLQDDTLNPLLQDDDQITVYEKPEFKVHRAVQITGQVAKPGLYILDTERPTLSQLIERAGGFTPEAMPNAGIFFRNPLAMNMDPISNHAKDVSGITEILERLNETKIYDLKLQANTGATTAPSLFKIPVLHGLDATHMNRVVVDFSGAMAKQADADIELHDGDEVIIPRRTDTAMIIGETATPFALFKVKKDMSVGDLLRLAGGTTRNADTWNIRLLKADGHIVDRWVKRQHVEPGDAVLVPQVVRRATNWQENLAALTPLAILINAFRR